MIEIPRADYGRVTALFAQEGPNSTMAFAVLEGRTAGRVFADDPVSPTWSVVVASYYGVTVYGGPLEQEVLTSALAEVRQTQGLMLVGPPTWEGRLTPPEPAQRIERLEFLDYPSAAGHAGRVNQTLPEGCTLRRIDALLLARCLWQDEMLAAFGTSSNFLQHGLGFCLMRGEEILAEAYAVFLGAGRFEIGAVTAEAHRGQGYATMVCRHLCAECLARGAVPYWSCDRDNLASAATARRLGFQTERPYALLLYPQVTP